MSEELKPCPFCSGAAELDTMQGYRNISTKELADQAAVYCTRCWAHMTFCYADAPGEQREDIVSAVVFAWNRRDNIFTANMEIARLRAELAAAKTVLTDFITEIRAYQSPECDERSIAADRRMAAAARAAMKEIEA